MHTGNFMGYQNQAMRGPQKFQDMSAHTQHTHTHIDRETDTRHTAYPAAICLSAAANYGHYHAEAEIDSVKKRKEECHREREVGCALKSMLCKVAGRN